MQIKNEEELFLISKFKRNGHQLTSKSLLKTIEWLHQHSANSIELLIKKINHLSMDNSYNIQQNLQHAIQILSIKNKNLNSYDDLLQQTRKRSIYYISPYQNNQENWFTERPQRELFEFMAEDKLKNAQSLFKRISEANKELGKDKEGMFGVVYESYSGFLQGLKSRIVIQNQVNEVQLFMPSDFTSNNLIINGCAYMVKGKQQGKSLQLFVDSINLPLPSHQEKNTLLKEKFKQMCHNITNAKLTSGFQPFDFLKYDCVYSHANEQLRPTLIFGNVTVNLRNVERLRKLIEGFKTGVGCLILLLSGEDQESIDLGVWFKCKTFLIPHINSEGPRVLPKLPILKASFGSAKILTNPAKLSIEGRQVVIANYPLIRNIFSTCLMGEQVQISQENMIPKVADLLFSQGNIAIAQEYYWKQLDYFRITSESLVVINDSVASSRLQRNKWKGGMATTGNFQRDGQFLLIMHKSKNLIEMCQQPQE